MEFGCWKWMRVEMKLTEGRGANSPKCAPVHQEPANGNKQAHGPMSLDAAACSDWAWSVQIVSVPANSFHGT